MYTTTFPKALAGPVTTLSVIIGVECCLAQLGSFAMSIGRIFGGVPVKVTWPLIAPAFSAGCPNAMVADAPTARRARDETSMLDIGAPFLRV
jgi:hypothetical protein